MAQALFAGSMVSSLPLATKVGKRDAKAWFAKQWHGDASTFD